MIPLLIALLCVAATVLCYLLNALDKALKDLEL